MAYGSSTSYSERSAYSTEGGMQGIFSTRGTEVVKQLNVSLEEQRRRRRMKAAPSNNSMQFMSPSANDLLGPGGAGRMFT